MGMRRATKKGTWYDGSAGTLNQQLTSWLESAIPEGAPERDLAAIIAPHAGYFYSGETASHSYARILQEHNKNDIKRVFVFGPSHHAHLGKCAITGFGELETPLGNLKVDSSIREELLGTGLFQLTPSDIDEEEHSIELHLPYIAKVMEGVEFTVIPIMVDALQGHQLESTATVLATYFDVPGNIFIISSDFCHWGRRFGYQPYDKMKGEICEFIRDLDGEAMSCIETQSRENFLIYLNKTQNTICGRYPIMVYIMTSILSKINLSFLNFFLHYIAIFDNDGKVYA